MIDQVPIDKLVKISLNTFGIELSGETPRLDLTENATPKDIRKIPKQ